MLLPDREITDAIQAGHLGVTPFDPALVQPASLDVRLHDRFLVLDPPAPTQAEDSEEEQTPYLNPAADSSSLFQPMKCAAGQGMLLGPGQCALASTFETFQIPDDLAARFEGKSSLGRLFLLAHVTAGFIDPGFSGRITLELVNLAHVPIALYPGMRIGQLSFTRLAGRAGAPYGSTSLGSHYQGQDWPTPSRSFERFAYGLPEGATA